MADEPSQPEHPGGTKPLRTGAEMSNPKPITVLAVTSQGATLRNNATKVEVLVGWSTLKAAATQGDAELSRIYGDALADAVAMNEVQLERERLARIAGCREHRAMGTKEGPFLGPVSRDERRAAHGNICITETCACGATRKTNVNGVHFEQGVWS
jgi:hypothetical protein